MARSDSTQHYGSVVLHDYGYVTLGSDGTFAVKTRLSQLFSGSATHRSGNLFATTLRVSALSSGTVTITDAAGANASGALVFYDLKGV